MGTYSSVSFIQKPRNCKQWLPERWRSWGGGGLTQAQENLGMMMNMFVVLIVVMVVCVCLYITYIYIICIKLYTSNI